MSDYFQNHDYVIESDVPLPPNPSHGTPMFPWAQMKVGDSFATGPKFNRWKHTQAVAGSAAKYADNHESAFRIRMRHEGKTGVRVWRVA